MKWRRFIVLAGALGIGLAQAELREFTDVKGRKLEAEFVNLLGDKAALRLATGKIVQVPLERLSEADREWIRKEAEGAAVLPENPLHPVRNWNEKAEAYESYFIDYNGERAFARRFTRIHPDGFAGYNGEFCVVEGPYYGVVNTRGEALFGVGKKMAEKVESGSDVAIFPARFGRGAEAYFTYLRKDGRVIMRSRFAG
ncbi:MAG: hypothetical protein GWO24_25710, partial [Akkermansiaceae bacterium]|nr:hypothetical protein [Akkermansiaceae bacterium]